MSINFSIDTFDIGLFHKLTELFSDHFASNDRLLSKTYTEWLYSKNPFGPAKIVTATQDGRWLGFMALVRVCLARQHAVQPGYFVVNVFIHPKQRGKNVFKLMIDQAIQYVKNEHAILMGHPNSLAYGAWRRAEMHFQPPLKPYLVTPEVFRRDTAFYDVADVSQLEPFISIFNEQGRRSKEWQVLLSEDYVAWRYLQHPTNHYRLRAIKTKDGLAGFFVVKQICPGLNMLIDQFLLYGSMDVSLGCAPWFTVAFTTEAFRKRCSRLWTIPSKKELPFFCTDFLKPIEAREIMRLALSASDF